MANWREFIEENTGEVSSATVGLFLECGEDYVLDFVKSRHGARYVGGTSRHLIWKEDAEALEIKMFEDFHEKLKGQAYFVTEDDVRTALKLDLGHMLCCIRVQRGRFPALLEEVNGAVKQVEEAGEGLRDVFTLPEWLMQAWRGRSNPRRWFYRGMNVAGRLDDYFRAVDQGKQPLIAAKHLDSYR